MRLYFMGICGTGMGNAAVLMNQLGHEVSGADTGTYPPMSDVLYHAGIPLFEGYVAERLASMNPSPDLVVVGNAISRGNPEVEWLLDNRKIPYVSLPELLRQRLLLNRRNIVIAGTHGKTTTTALTSFILQRNDLEPGYLIGGVSRDFPQGVALGDPSAPFVIEGDEYDSAFFDKRSKFINYCPHTLVINNLEFDHGDIFRDLEDVKRTFNHVIRIVPGNGCIVANGDDPNMEALLDVSWTKVVRAGLSESNNLVIKNFTENHAGSRFDLFFEGKFWSHVAWSQHGIYNARNVAMAAMSAAMTVCPENPCRLNLHDLSSFMGVKRRQEVLYDKGQYTVVEDFAHHPTAVKETLISLRNRFPDARLTACFEPRSNTSRQNYFQGAYADALAVADCIQLAPVFRGESLSADRRLDTAGLAAGLRQAGKDATAHSSNECLLQSLRDQAQTKEKEATVKQVICFFSNGSFSGIMPHFVDFLNRKNAPAGR